VVKGAQLGLSSSGVARWVRTGRLHPLYRGVYAYGHTALSEKGRWMAAVLAAGEGAALAGLSAAVLWRATRWKDTVIDVLVPRPRASQRGFRTRICRNLDPRDVTVVDRIPVTTVARTLVDLADDMDAEDLANVIHEAAYRKLFSLAATRAAIARANGRRDLPVLQRALAMHLDGSAGTKSRLEKAVRRLARAGGCAEPVSNVQISGYEVDLYWPGVCVEVDGPGHERPRTKAEDRARDAALRAAGYTVLRFTEEDVVQRPRTILAALAAAGVS
jgi:very-short-patch-repair endonuclease